MMKLYEVTIEQIKELIDKGILEMSSDLVYIKRGFYRLILKSTIQEISYKDKATIILDLISNEVFKGISPSPVSMETLQDLFISKKFDRYYMVNVSSKLQELVLTCFQHHLNNTALNFIKILELVNAALDDHEKNAYMFEKFASTLESENDYYLAGKYRYDAAREFENAGNMNFARENYYKSGQLLTRFLESNPNLPYYTARHLHEMIIISFAKANKPYEANKALEKAKNLLQDESSREYLEHLEKEVSRI